MTLQRTQATSISKHALIKGESSSRLGILPPFSLVDILLGVLLGLPPFL
jgi:hypothetical protein